MGVEHCFLDLDRALEWAEDRLLATHGIREQAIEEQSWRSNAVCRDFSEEELTVLGRSLERFEYQPGELILKRGEVGDALYLQTTGLTSITILLGGSRTKRLMAYGAGAVFGEMSLLEGKARAAEVRAERVTELHRLSGDAFKLLLKEQPHLGVKLLWNLGRELSERLRAAQSEIQVLDR